MKKHEKSGYTAGRNDGKNARAPRNSAPFIFSHKQRPEWMDAYNRGYAEGRDLNASANWCRA